MISSQQLFIVFIVSIVFNAVLLAVLLAVILTGRNRTGSNSQLDFLAGELRSLHEIFLKPKTRGGLGERLLYRILEDSIPGKYWERQYRFSTGAIADAVVRLGKYIIPVDSKFPREGAGKLMEQPELKAQAQATKEIRKHIDTIREKYIRPDEGTLQFALMYLPSEGMYYSLFLEEPSALFDYALKARVIPVGPGTFFTYLQTIAYGLQGFAVSERGDDILKSVTQMQIDFIESMRLMEKTEQHTRNAGNALTELKTRLDKLGAKLESLKKLEI